MTDFVSPSAEIAITSITFCPLAIDICVEKFPDNDGVVIVSTPFIKIVITASLLVLPDTIIVFLSTTSSSFGLSKDKEIEGREVGVGDAIEITFVLGKGAFVTWKK